MAKKILGQLSFNEILQHTAPKELDRNFHLGGRSFYFFDFDDNIVFLATPVKLFHQKTHSAVEISSGEFARHHKYIGVDGKFKDFYINYDDSVGTFSYFRDMPHLAYHHQPFVSDIEVAMQKMKEYWQAPSWQAFYHATYNHRPISLITARGHHPETIKAGIELFVDRKILPHKPNYHTIFPINHKETRATFGDPDFKMSVPKLKQLAIRKSVEEAISKYGPSPFHRFGMSDDDPHNIELIVEEMRALKSDFPEMSFFVIETKGHEFIKYEVLLNETRIIVSQAESNKSQLTLF